MVAGLHTQARARDQRNVRKCEERRRGQPAVKDQEQKEVQEAQRWERGPGQMGNQKKAWGRRDGRGGELASALLG